MRVGRMLAGGDEEHDHSGPDGGRRDLPGQEHRTRPVVGAHAARQDGAVPEMEGDDRGGDQDAERGDGDGGGHP